MRNKEGNTYMRRLIIIVSAMIMLSIMCCGAYADEEEIYTEGLFRYTVKDNKVTIVDYGYDWSNADYDNILSEIYLAWDISSNKIPILTEVVIPTKIGGMKVVDVKI